MWASRAYSFTDDICTAFRPHPDFMNFAGLDIDPITNGVGDFLRAFVLGVGDRQLPSENQVRGEPGM